MIRLEKEQYLYKVATKVLEWAEVKDYSQDELWDLIMLDLLNIKE